MIQKVLTERNVLKQIQPLNFTIKNRGNRYELKKGDVLTLRRNGNIVITRSAESGKGKEQLLWPSRSDRNSPIKFLECKNNTIQDIHFAQFVELVSAFIGLTAKESHRSGNAVSYIFS